MGVAKGWTLTGATYACIHVLSLFLVIIAIILEKAMAPHSSALAWEIPWMEEPGGLQSTGSQRVGRA